MGKLECKGSPQTPAAHCQKREMGFLSPWPHESLVNIELGNHEMF